MMMKRVCSDWADSDGTAHEKEKGEGRRRPCFLHDEYHLTPFEKKKPQQHRDVRRSKYSTLQQQQSGRRYKKKTHRFERRRSTTSSKGRPPTTAKNDRRQSISRRPFLIFWVDTK